MFFGSGFGGGGVGAAEAPYARGGVAWRVAWRGGVGGRWAVGEVGA
jgi:hypothetical protein